MDLGAHVSTAGGISKAVERAQEIGAETIQIFASSPRAWAFKPLSEDHILAFREAAEKAGIRSTFIHALYLVNVGGAPDLVEKSVAALGQNMHAAGQIGAEGVIFHSGSHKGVGFDAVLDQAADALTRVLADGPPDVQLIIENCAGMGAQIGASFAELGRLVKAIDHPRLKICLDTEHAFAAGYNIADPDGIEGAMAEFDKEIGLDRLVVVHANDAKVELASGLDRHENIGEGNIGLAGFETIMAHPAFQDLPFLLEVPGEDKKGPDKANLDRLKEIRQRLAGA
ncbi:MAG: deoxyribonuclease IV [Chloroflexi bacterium]|nr:deoxyribonuclease IV [Chloroflexota bacterium]MCI0796998.1 deoxyribonuclease IV [Chloroflexota bacterium]